MVPWVHGISNIIIFLAREKIAKTLKRQNLKSENLLVVSKKIKWSTTSTTSSIGTALLSCLIGQYMLQYVVIINETRK